MRKALILLMVIRNPSILSSLYFCFVHLLFECRMCIVCELQFKLNVVQGLWLATDTLFCLFFEDEK